MEPPRPNALSPANVPGAQPTTEVALFFRGEALCIIDIYTYKPPFPPEFPHPDHRSQITTRKDGSHQRDSPPLRSILWPLSTTDRACFKRGRSIVPYYIIPTPASPGIPAPPPPRADVDSKGSLACGLPQTESHPLRYIVLPLSTTDGACFKRGRSIVPYYIIPTPPSPGIPTPPPPRADLDSKGSLACGLPRREIPLLRYILWLLSTTDGACAARGSSMVPCYIHPTPPSPGMLTHNMHICLRRDRRVCVARFFCFEALKVHVFSVTCTFLRSRPVRHAATFLTN